MNKRLKIDGFTLPAEIRTFSAHGAVKRYGSVAFTKRAERACGLHRSDFADCTPRECKKYQATRKGLREWAGAEGLEWVDLYTDDAALGAVGPLHS